MRKIPGIICTYISLAIVYILIVVPQYASAAELSSESQECIDCHSLINPGIVEDWAISRHAGTSADEAMLVEPIARRISSENIPEPLNSAAVGCYECHSLNADKHTDNFEHFGYSINVIVSPADCSTCHSAEVEQYSNSKKAHALDILRKNPIYDGLVGTITSLQECAGAHLSTIGASDNAKNESCYACHGTQIEVTGLKTVETDLGEIEIPMLTNYPNQGVGRINPDGSYGACTSCHPRHSFDIAIARKPETCSQCHLEPDVPAYNVYRESKHGNIYYSNGNDWTWDEIPWHPGTDFKAPTCATCHNSLLANGNDEIIAERSHDFGDRLWVRLFGLIYSHPQPKDGRTYLIENSDKQSLPTTLDGKLADEYLLSQTEQFERRGKMAGVCRSCHSTDWIESQFARLDTTILDTDKMVLAATQLIQYAWKNDLADQANLFDEKLEQYWVKQWLFYANSVRYASAMMGPDYGAFKNGWWYLNSNLEEMEKYINQYQK